MMCTLTSYLVRSRPVFIQLPDFVVVFSTTSTTAWYRQKNAQETKTCRIDNISLDRLCYVSLIPFNFNFNLNFNLNFLLFFIYGRSYSIDIHRILQGRIVGESGCNTLIDNSLRTYRAQIVTTLSPLCIIHKISSMGDTYSVAYSREYRGPSLHSVMSLLQGV